MQNTLNTWKETGGVPSGRFPLVIMAKIGQNTKILKFFKSWFKSDVILANLNQYQILHLLNPST